MITRTHREHTARVAMISSIARSQEALADILQNIAEVSAHSDVTARKLAENIRLLTGYQSVMTEMLTGIPLNRTQWGSPSSPWLAVGRIANSSTAAQEESKDSGG
ncbi:hypothetical protein PVOR_09340 [Paenibacillus vortex V453]|jgi:hypothetical protein|uniref:Uncharacterized protein n=2 Tax=Paenibacillus TaxID=44249 RepID=A0A163KP21_9BACL|nr:MULTISPECIES: hypothetical protein [Paenibacillus]ANA81343.1 hypothetical protein A3958_15780 [Paenibacillus glucanolyticus]AWP29182.1 hypothetical protein B9D94_22325 [Paenibacillus sp. Cedars]EFU42460.1 hypothetical protein PVOR_09340 [Paenibacillus vortex V453]ETT35579.1 hypothetical protein C169_16264 [Paenibacillus sp. FSL R5-808]KZS47395.1 hypothetical protein AWU65_16400 [Paenibacillus glucanolyticus]